MKIYWCKQKDIDGLYSNLRVKLTIFFNSENVGKVKNDIQDLKYLIELRDFHVVL